MKANSYEVGQTYTNEMTNKQMTVTGKHRAGNYRGAKTIWHVEIDGEKLEKDSEQLKRIFWGEKKAYTGTKSGSRVVVSEEAIDRKIANYKQKIEQACAVLAEFGFATPSDRKIDAVMTEKKAELKKAALEAEAERKAKKEATAEERKAKKESLDVLKGLTPEQLKAIVASLQK
jgi:hypothetical protein